MIIVTGAQGFIGSTMISYLNSIGMTDIVAVDDFGIDHQKGYAYRADYTNLQDCRIQSIHPVCLSELDILPAGNIDVVFHFGAISNTLEKDVSKINYYNTEYTRILGQVCNKKSIPLIFSSTAAVYGNGDGPLNLYAESKLQSENDISGHAACLRLFNVYGHREKHKGRMASVIFKWQQELQDTNSICLFENSNKYMRDFVFVNDVCKIANDILKVYKPGVYDLGSGHSRSFEEVADCLIKQNGLGIKKYISMPNDLKSQYQENTKADMQGLLNLGIIPPMTSIEDGIKTYIGI